MTSWYLPSGSSGCAIRRSVQATSLVPRSATLLVAVSLPSTATKVTTPARSTMSAGTVTRPVSSGVRLSATAEGVARKSRVEKPASWERSEPAEKR